MKLYYPGQRGGPFGWGVFGENMVKALAEHFEIVDVSSEADVLFTPCADHHLNPVATPNAPINIGMTFFEYPLGEKAAENAAKFDHLFCGSTWNLDRLWERGIKSEVLIQGVDHSIFKPGPRESILDAPKIDAVSGLPIGKKRQFRIFSGGKFEWRKGQDLVIRAFAEFSKRHADAHLVCSWFNPWPGLIADMVGRTGPSFYYKRDSQPAPERYTQEDFFADTIQANGIPRDRFTILPQLGQQELAREMQNTDVGLFPNRCEGGTNLVLMEYAACGKRIVANRKTGHRDVGALIDVAIECEEDAAHWADQRVEKIDEALEIAYAERHLPKRMPEVDCHTWPAAAKKVAAAVERLAGSAV